LIGWAIKAPIMANTAMINIICFFWIMFLLLYAAFVAFFYFFNENFRRFKSWNIMLWNNDSCIFGNVTSCFFCSFSNNKTSEASDINILTFYHRIFHYFKKRFDRLLNVNLF